MEKSIHSFTEKTVMVILTAISNFWGIPGTIGLFAKKEYYIACIGCFTVVCSFMYHLLDAIQLDIFFIDEGHWHRLDNVGSIASFISLVVFLMDNKDPKVDEKLNYIGLFITLIV